MDIHTLTGIQTQEHIAWEAQDILCLRPREYCDGQVCQFKYLIISTIIELSSCFELSFYQHNWDRLYRSSCVLDAVLLNCTLQVWVWRLWIFKWKICWWFRKGLTKTKLHGLNPRANYTDRATTACRQRDCQLFADRGCQMVSVTDPYGHILGFLDRSRYFSIK
jgi:hypothetical protein